MAGAIKLREISQKSGEENEDKVVQKHFDTAKDGMIRDTTYKNILKLD